MSTNETQRVRVSDDRFISEWFRVNAEGGTTKDLAGRLGIRVTSIYSRSKRMLKNGVELPALQRGKRTSKNWDAAKALAKELAS